MKKEIQIIWPFSLLFLCIFSFEASSQHLPENIERVPLEDLINVISIAEDHQGFLWFGNGQGLYRYDGTHLKNYTHLRNDTSTISNNNIEGLLVDHTGLIWISTNHGLNCFNPLTEKNKKYFHDPKNPNSISSDYLDGIAEDKEGNIWIGSFEGLSRIDPKSGKITAYHHDKNDTLSISPGKVFCIFIDHLNQYWVGTEHGLNLLDPETNQFHHFFNGRPAITLGSWQIMNILEDNSGILWLATWGEGVIKYDPQKNISENYWLRPDRKHTGDHNVVMDIEFADAAKKYLYVSGSDDKLFLLDVNREMLTAVTKSAFDASLISDGLSLFKDSRGNVWLGTQGYLYKIKTQKNNFSEYNFSPVLSSDCLSAVNTIYEEEDASGNNIIWVGTWTCGLIKADYINNKTLSTIKGLNPPGKDTYYQITCMWRDHSGILWIGTDAGLGQLTEGGEYKKMYTQVHDGTTTLSNNGVQCIFEASDHKLWIGTLYGLNLFDPGSKQFIQYFPSKDIPETSFNSNNIRRINELPTGDLLVLVERNDIYKFDQATNTFTNQLHSIIPQIDSIGFIYDFIIDTRGELWCAGSLGVLKIKNPFSRPSVKLFTTVQGLSFDYATGLLEDNCGKIWIATRKGLNVYDEGDNTFKQFYTHDGIHANNVEGVAIKGISGNLFIGYSLTEKNEIINFFDPCHWNNDTLITPVVISGIKILNNDLGIINNQTGLDNIRLGNKDRMITFEFVELNYLPAEHNKYAYRLEGFDDDWIYAGSNTTATYTNLNGGNYVFKVKSINNFNATKENMAMISFFVTPVFYKTFWFYTLCIFLLAGIFYLLYTLRITQLKKLYAVRLAISHDLHDDIGSRLSSISILTQLADQKKSDPNFNISRFYDQVMKGTKEAMEIMNDIVWSVNPKYDKLNNTLIRMREYASEILEAKNIDFKINAKASLQDTLLTMKHRKDFYLIFKEAINNLAKYAECTMVDISILKENDSLILLIEDNGKGFDIDAVKKGNGMNTMQARADSIKGKLLIRSAVNQGTTIRLEIPVT